MKGALVLRPEPGNSATAARLAQFGTPVRRCPLFVIRPLAWSPPDPGQYDSLLLTSANAARHAGSALASLAALPVLAVGAATARSAQAAGLAVALTGTTDAADLLETARARGWSSPLHLTGAHHAQLAGVTSVATYASEALPVAREEVAAWQGHVALLHSPRAARRFARLVGDGDIGRASIAIAALSPAIAAAAGEGWVATTVAEAPRDDRLVAAALALIDPSGGPADKHPA